MPYVMLPGVSLRETPGRNDGQKIDPQFATLDSPPAGLAAGQPFSGMGYNAMYL